MRDALERAQVRVREGRAQLEASLEPIRVRAEVEEAAILSAASGLEQGVEELERRIATTGEAALRRKLYANSERSLWEGVRAPASLVGVGACAVVVGLAASTAGVVLPLPAAVAILAVSATAMVGEARAIGRGLSGRDRREPPSGVDATPASTPEATRLGRKREG
jgi:hypothetical protein